MTRGPRRLKDDPDFKWETGCNLSDEEMLVGEYDLKGTRSRLLAAVALAAPSSGDVPEATAATVGDGIPAIRPGAVRSAASASRWTVALKPFAAVVTGAIVVAGAYWLGVKTGAGDLVPSEPAAVESIGTPDAREPDEGKPFSNSEFRDPIPAIEGGAAALEGTADAEPIARVTVPEARAAGARSSSPGSPAGLASDLPAPTALEASPQASAPAPSEVQGTAEAPPGEASSSQAPSSTLKAETDALSLASGALADRDYKEALSRYESYLSSYPNGRLRIEAQIGRLHALVGIGDKAAAESSARALQDLPALAGRRSEILQLRAESLVLLDRCEEALALAEEIPARAAAEVRRACRRSGKESP